MLIANATPKLSIRLQISKEAGLRPIELCNLRAKDIDIDHKTINPLTAKKGCARTIPIPQQLTALLQAYIIKHNLTQKKDYSN